MFTLNDLVSYYRLFCDRNTELVIKYDGAFHVSLFGHTSSGNSLDDACENWLKMYLNDESESENS